MTLTEPIKPFLLERYFAKYEFEAPYMLSSSDCETLSIADLLSLAGRSTADLGALTLGYTESPGSPTLRVEIASYYDTPIAADDLLIVVPEEGIFLTMWALLSPGDQVIVQNALLSIFVGVSDLLPGQGDSLVDPRNRSRLANGCWTARRPDFVKNKNDRDEYTTQSDRLSFFR